MAAVRYMVSDVEAALEFYTGALGFVLVERWGPPFAIIQRDDLEIWLSGPGTSASLPMPDGTMPQSGGWNRVVLEVEDITGTIDRLREAGARFRNELITGPGGSQILIEDPSGNPIELFEPRG